MDSPAVFVPTAGSPLPTQPGAPLQNSAHLHQKGCLIGLIREAPFDPQSSSIVMANHQQCLVRLQPVCCRTGSAAKGVEELRRPGRKALSYVSVCTPVSSHFLYPIKPSFRCSWNCWS